MAATPKPVRKLVKSEKKAMKAAVNNPKHGLSHGAKKKNVSHLIHDSKSRHTKLSTKMGKFRKKHPGEAYEQ